MTVPIPVAVLTGFLGSGKTTLLARLLRHPAFSRTAVVINEFGAVGLDHELVVAGDESVVELRTGCLCCTIRGDLAATLADLLARRAAGTVPPFERVVIETSGLADPAPILQALMSDAGLAERLALATVVTTVDAAAGLATLNKQFESRKQVAVADRLILTKTDLAPAPDALRVRLAALNPLAPVEVASFGAIDPDGLFAGGLYNPSTKAPDVANWLAGSDVGRDGGGHASVHDHDHTHAHDPDRHDAEISCFTLQRDAPLPAIALTLFLETLAEHCGADLLRLKGLVAVAESPDRPAVIHGVQHVFHPPTWLDAWPSADRRTRLVFIGRRLHRPWIEALLAAIEAEVAEVSRRLA